MDVRLQMRHIALFGNTFRRGLYGSNGLNRALSYYFCITVSRDDRILVLGLGWGIMDVRLHMSHIALFGNTFRRGLYCSNGLNRALSYDGFTFDRYGHDRWDRWEGTTRLQDIIGGEAAMYDTIREHIQAMIKGQSGVIIMGSEDGISLLRR